VRAQALERLEWIADAYLPVSAPVARAAPAWLAAAPAIRAPLLERLRGNLARLQAELPAASACQVLAPAGGWTAVVRVPRLRSEEEWVRLLAERHGVVVQPGYFYDFEQEAYLVVSLLARPAEFSAGVAALRACLE
jgi:aspartate/methionine/tyrosine aminotransferase